MTPRMRFQYRVEISAYWFFSKMSPKSLPSFVVTIEPYSLVVGFCNLSGLQSAGSNEVWLEQPSSKSLKTAVETRSVFRRNFGVIQHEEFIQRDAIYLDQPPRRLEPTQAA